MHSSEPLVLWCKAVDTNDDKKAPVKLKKAIFRSPVLTYEPQLLGDSTTANLTVDEVPVTAAGRWSCDLETENGNTTGYIEVFRELLFKVILLERILDNGSKIEKVKLFERDQRPDKMFHNYLEITPKSHKCLTDYQFSISCRKIPHHSSLGFASQLDGLYF